MEGSGAEREGGSPPGNAWRPALEGQAGEPAAGAEGTTREGAPARGGRNVTTRPQPWVPLGAPHFAGRLCTPTRRTQPTASPALPLGCRRGRGRKGGAVVGSWRRKMGKTLSRPVARCNSCSGAVCRGRGLSEWREGGRRLCRGSGCRAGAKRRQAMVGAPCKGDVVCRLGPQQAFCLLGQGESHRMGGWSGGERTAGTRVLGPGADCGETGIKWWDWLGARGDAVEAPQSLAFLDCAVCGALPRPVFGPLLTLPAPRSRPRVIPSPTNFADGKVKSCRKLDGVS